MTYFLFFSSLIIGLIFKKSKLVSVYILTCLYILAAFNYSNADYFSYTVSYYNSASSNYKFRYAGYSFLTHYFASRGVSYDDFIKALFIFIFIILYIAINLLTDRPNMVLSFFTLFSFGVDAIQLKAFISEVIALLGLALMFRAVACDSFSERTKMLYISAFLVSIIAGLMHYSALFYTAVGILFVCIKNKETIKKKILILLLLLSFMLYGGMLPYVLKIGTRFGLVSNMDYLEQWGNKSTHFGFIITFVGVFLLLFSILLDNDSNSKLPLQKVMYYFTFSVVLLLPLLMMNWAYNRLIRVYTIIVYSYFSNKNMTFHPIKKQIVSLTVMVVMALYLFLIDIFSEYDGTLGALLNYSGFLK